MQFVTKKKICMKKVNYHRSMDSELLKLVENIQMKLLLVCSQLDLLDCTMELLLKW